MKQNRIYLNYNDSVDFTFLQNRYDFIVEELPCNFSNSGNFMILKIKKEYLSTWELIDIISDKLDIPEHHIGYSGLKDKNATTTQYISIPVNKSRDYEKLNSKNVQVIETYKHNQKLKIGDLVGNKFIITLKDIKPEQLHIIYQNLSKIQKHGIPNYFGYQRFGKDTTFEQTKAVAYGEEVLGDKKLETMLISSYQSYFFNNWLAARVKLAKEQNSNKLIELDGDIYSHKDRSIITGLLPGRKAKRATSKAREIEAKYDDEFIHQKGFRRDAWIKPTNIKNKSLEDGKWLQLEFDLPKSSYATVFIEALGNIELKG
jgi:tRNA pseudouridine13 synthase